MNQNKSIQEQKQAQPHTKNNQIDQEQSQSRRLVGGEIHRLNNKRGCPPNKQILTKDVSMEPKKPLQKILNFKAHFAGTIDHIAEIPTVNKMNVTKFNNANQNDLYHQVSQSQRVKILRTNYQGRQIELGRPKANSRHQNPALKKFETKVNNTRSQQASPIHNKLNKDVINCQQNNERIIIN